MSASTPPEDVLDAVKVIRRLREKKYLTREEKIENNRAKLRVAYWACRSENIVASRETLVYILGSDGAEIMGHYERYLEREKAKADGKKKEGGGDGSAFWDGA
jgi:hypothetical protein